jgi:hypothetical protein
VSYHGPTLPAITALLIVKYVGAVLAVIYGVYATTTEFHSGEVGQRTLTKRGRVGLCLLLAAGIASLASDAFKDTIERRQRQADHQVAARVERQQQHDRAVLAQANERLTATLSQQLNYSRALSTNLDNALAKVNANFSLSRAVLHHTLELRHPLRDVTASFGVGYGAPPIFAKYLARLEASDKMQKGGVEVSSDSDLWPKLTAEELPALLILGSQTLRLDFYKKQPEITQTIPPSDLTMYFRTYLTRNSSQFQPLHALRYLADSHDFFILAENIAWQPVNLSDANIFSSRELANTYCIVQLPQEWQIALTNLREVLNVRRDARIRLVNLRTADGDDLIIYSMHPHALANGEVAYLGYCERRPVK